MWKFSLREVILVMTMFAIAMAVNVWNHRDLRTRLAHSQEHAEDVEAYASRLHRNLGYAKSESDEFNSLISGWLASGELKPLPRTICITGRSSPDWTIL